MQRRNSTQSTASLLTHRGLMVGVPLIISLVFSGLYTISQKPQGGQAASSATEVQKAAKATGVRVVTPPAASKLKTEDVTKTSLNTTSTNANPANSQSQSSTDATENVQQATNQAPQPASKNGAVKLQNKAKF